MVIDVHGTQIIYLNVAIGANEWQAAVAEAFAAMKSDNQLYILDMKMQQNIKASQSLHGPATALVPFIIKPICVWPHAQLMIMVGVFMSFLLTHLRSVLACK